MQDTAGDFDSKTTKAEKSKICWQEEHPDSHGSQEGLFLLLSSFYCLWVKTNVVLKTPLTSK